MARVTAVCISEKKGEQKYPVDKIRIKPDHGIQGDAHSGNWHRQISLLGKESVAKVQPAMDYPLEPGAFAENILTEGIELFSLPIGTVLEIGETLCEVTQIGKECHHGCAIRQLAGDCVMPREGIFVKVLRGGEIRPGDDIRLLWDECVRFHGHSCGGLIIGYKAALYALELLDGMPRSEDEELVCIAENDACGIDGIQYILGCTMGKGNLHFHIVGKQAFNFYHRGTGKSFRILLREREMSREEMKNLPGHELFETTEPVLELPEKASIFLSVDCEACGERTAEPYLRLREGKKLCLSCYQK